MNYLRELSWGEAHLTGVPRLESWALCSETRSSLKCKTVNVKLSALDWGILGRKE